MKDARLAEGLSRPYGKTDKFNALYKLGEIPL